MFICLDCGTILNGIEIDYDRLYTDGGYIIKCPVCGSDNLCDKRLEMYVNDKGSI